MPRVLIKTLAKTNQVCLFAYKLFKQVSPGTLRQSINHTLNDYFLVQESLQASQ